MQKAPLGRDDDQRTSKARRHQTADGRRRRDLRVKELKQKHASVTTPLYKVKQNLPASFPSPEVIPIASSAATLLVLALRSRRRLLLISAHDLNGSQNASVH